MELVRKPHPNDGWYRIYPSSAQELLDNRAKNRPLREASAEKISRLIIENEYVENGETIVFDNHGRVIDGQNRLRACVLANKPIVSYCVHLNSCGPRVFDSIDQGRSRSCADRIAIDGNMRYALCSAISRWVFLIDTSKPGAVPIRTGYHAVSVHDVRSHYYKYKSEIDYAAELCGAAKKQKGLIPGSILGTIHVIGQRKSRETADAFVNGILSGSNLPSNSPILMLRNRVIKESSSRHSRPNHIMLMALTIKAWNATATNSPLNVLRWGNDEPFPSIVQK